MESLGNALDLGTNRLEKIEKLSLQFEKIISMCPLPSKMRLK